MSRFPDDTRFDCIVVCAGAAGLMAALHAAAAGERTLLVEGTPDGGKKILISGGGRCNVLPSRLDTTRYVSSSPHRLLKKILRSWSLADQRRFFEEEIGLRLVLEEESGKLFPESNRARDVRDGLVDWARRSGAAMLFNTRVSDIRPDGTGGWDVLTGNGTPLHSRRVVIATGGLSVPKTGSDGVGLRIASALGYDVAPTYPALTPLLRTPPVHGELAGLSLDVVIEGKWKEERRVTTGGFLFTHRGYSGPSVLDVSDLPVRSLLEGDEPARLLVRWVAGDESEWRGRLTAGGGTTILALLRAELPLRLAEQLIIESGADPSTRCADLERSLRERLIESLTRYPLDWNGDEGYRKAEVTGGGVRLEEVDPRTMESRRDSGLYFCGEVLDAFGPIGGYNFLWAWVTGRAAGRGGRAAE